MDIEYVYPSQNPRLDACSKWDASCEQDILGMGDLSFKDIIDVVNPLQQLPIIGSIYRAVSGDTLSTASRLAGGALMGGPIGFMVAAVNAGIEAATGGDIGEHIFAMFDSDAEKRLYAQNAYGQAQKLPS